ncbi:unnamed protein product [Ixodes hexagonus]
MKPDRVALFYQRCVSEPSSPLQPGLCGPPAYTAAVARRNERERNRVRLVNHGFNALRQHVPQTAQKKLSKVETLRSAVEYIKELQELLGLTRGVTNPSSSSSPTSSSSFGAPKENRVPSCAYMGSAEASPDSNTNSSEGTPRTAKDCPSPGSEECAVQDQDALWELASWWPGT